MQPHWQFDEEAPGRVDFLWLEHAGRALEARCLQTDKPTTLLSLHGANSDYTKLNPLLYGLQALGVGSVNPCLSGHSRASGVALGSTSLSQNADEALAFACHMKPHLQAVHGHSMGGALALKVAQAHAQQIDRIVLSCPAVYPDEAFSHAFGAAFKQAIGTPFGFLNSSSLDFLREFTGKVLLIMGDYDGLKSTDHGGQAGQSAGIVSVNDPQHGVMQVNSVIPFEVVQALTHSSRRGQLTSIVLPQCDHGMSTWLRARPHAAQALAGQIAQFLQ
jgi:pimeloyl-ACP methyl ester carboxylesterase